MQKHPRTPIELVNAWLVFLRKLAGRSQRPAGVFQRQILSRVHENTVRMLKQALQERDMPLADVLVSEIELVEGLAEPPEPEHRARRERLVSVVIPLFNGAATIEEALRSVFLQTRQPDEVIVVDDGSTDDGPALVERLAAEHPIRLLRKSNGGQSSARNFGIRHARGDLIALLDQDDAWYPRHVAELVRPFEEPRTKPLGWSYSNLDEIDRDGHLVTASVLTRGGVEHPKTDLLKALRRDMFVLPSATVISREAFEAVGGFDERLRGYEDDDLFVRLLRAGFDNVYIPQSLSRWRIYPESSSFSPQMARSRMIFARKLMGTFPDSASRNLFCTRDLIVPRFLREVAENLRRALQAGDWDLADFCAANIDELEAAAAPSDRPLLLRGDFPIPVVVTAIIPLYNGAAYIADALESVFGQTLLPDEVIVVNDGSTDDGPEIVSRLKFPRPIRLIRRENGGQSAARNTGVEHAHGDLVAFLDQDDCWYPDHLEELVNPFRMKSQSPLGWSYGDLDEIDKSGEMVHRGILRTHAPGAHPKLDLASCLGRDMLIFPSAAVVSRKAFLEVGGFNERLSGYEDDDLFLRLFRAGYQSAFLSASVAKWRKHDNNSSHSRRMAVSGMEFARILIDRFPDDPINARYYTRKLIAPRFLRFIAGNFRRSVLMGDREQQELALDHMVFMARYLGLHRRLPLRYLIVPVLRFSLAARVIATCGLPMMRLLRGMI